MNGRGSRLPIRLLVALLIGVIGCTAPVPPTPPTPSASSPPTPSASSPPALSVIPSAVLLSARGQTAVLLPSGAGGPVSWTSADPAVASIDGGGTVTAIAVGTTHITATAGELSSDPVLVTVATPVEGSVLLLDEQVVGGPTLVDSPAEATAETTYEVVLRGVTGLAPGDIVVGAEGRSIGGRVVAASAEGADLRVRLVSVPPHELFREFDFALHADLGEGEFEIDADLADAYEVVRDGATFTFTPRPTGRLPEPVIVLAQAEGTHALPPLPPFKECRASAGFGSGLPVPLSLSTSPTFTITAGGMVDFASTDERTTITVAATPTVRMASELQIRSAFEAKIDCRLTLVRRKFRVPGWAGLFFGGDVEFGVGFSVGGKVNLLSAKVGGQLDARPTLSATLDCPTGGDCTLTGAAGGTAELNPTLVAPSLDQAAFEPAVQLYGFVALEAGNADVEGLQFSAIEAKAGPELAASLTFEALQIDNVDATNGRSRYGLTLKGEVGPGIKLGGFLEYLGLSQAVPLKLAFESQLGTSPTGTAKADKPRYLPGEVATVTVKLDPASVHFPAGALYNIDRVAVLRKVGALTTEELVSQTVTTDGQTEFELTFTSQHLLDAADLFAFVVTRLLPLDPPKLELAGMAQTADCGILFRGPGGTLTVRSDGSDMKQAPAFALTRSPDCAQTASVFAGADHTGISIATADGSAQRILVERGTDPAWSPDGSKIAFVTDVPDAPWTYIAVINVDGSGFAAVSSTTGQQVGAPAWSPDGSRVVYAQVLAGTGSSEIWVADASGLNRRVLARPLEAGANTNVWFPDWTAAGDRILMVETRRQGVSQARILVMNGDGSNLAPLTSVADGLVAHAAFSPDGTMIAFSVIDPVTGNHTLFVMDADGSGKSEIGPGALVDW